VAESAKARDCEREGSVESRRNSKRCRLTRIVRCEIPFLPPLVPSFFRIRCRHRHHLTLTTSPETWTRSNRVLTMSNETPPMTAWGKAKFDGAKPVYGPRGVAGGLGNDPMMTCDPVGMPRYLFLEVSIYPMEFIQTSKRVLQHFEWGNVYRQIWMDGRELPK